MLVLDANDVTRLLDMASCIRAVEGAFRARGEGRAAPSATLGFPLDGGSLHVKVARLDRYVVAKVNANFPANPRERKLPTIQGALVLLDASCGTPLAVMDSAPITTLRTAATTAVAASSLARSDASTVTFVGCGVQARAHLTALCHVRSVQRVHAVDIRPSVADEFCKFVTAESGLECSVASSLRTATRASEIIVACTPAERSVLHLDDVSPGTFVAAVGADNEHKQEIDPALLRESVIVVDDLEQCARIGDLHHAIDAGVVENSYVRASLEQVVAGARRGRLTDEEIIVFDSTGLRSRMSPRPRSSMSVSSVRYGTSERDTPASYAQRHRSEFKIWIERRLAVVPRPPPKTCRRKADRTTNPRDSFRNRR